jgi:hypothetical protein
VRRSHLRHIHHLPSTINTTTITMRSAAFLVMAAAASVLAQDAGNYTSSYNMTIDPNSVTDLEKGKFWLSSLLMPCALPPGPNLLTTCFPRSMVPCSVRHLRDTL